MDCYMDYELFDEILDIATYEGVVFLELLYGYKAQYGKET